MRVNLHDLTYDALDALRAVAVANGSRAIVNNFTQPAAPALSALPAGVQFFDFDTLGRTVFPVLTPLVNTTPRVGPVGGTAMFYREVTGVNSGNVVPGVSEGNRNATIDRTTRDRVFKFAGLGLENVNTFESVYAARGVANPEELAQLDALKALKMAEERVLLYGFNAPMGGTAFTLGTPSAPAGVDTVVGSGEVSTMTTRNPVVCRVVALTGEGAALASVASGVKTTFVRTNADGSTDTISGGSSNKSAASAGVSVTAGHKVTWTVADVPGALGYAWYTGAAGAEKLAGITSINVFTQLADEGGGAQAATAITADNSVNALEFSGYLTMVQDPNSGAYYKSLDGAGLTADGSGNIKEFINAFYTMFNSWQGGPTELLMSALEAYNVTKILLGGPAAAIYQKFIAQSDSIVGGFYVSKVLNPFTGQMVNLTVHPYMPVGHILIRTYSMPYPIEGIGNIWEVVQRQPYYIIKWPAKTRKSEVGIYVDEGLKCELPFVQGVIKNVKSTL